MHTARRKVLTMVREQKLTVDEADELLSTIDVPLEPTPSSVPSPELIGTSDWSRKFRKILEKASKTQASALIQGEAGTGKELIARLIHYNSKRAGGPFFTLNCATSTTMLNSEIFGHEEGAFTGAIRARKGLLDATDGGTLFLDKIDALPADTQSKLYAFLQNGSFTRLGGTKPIHADVRIIGALYNDLKPLVDKGEFHSALYNHLSVCLLQPAPLRERREDISALAEHFAAKQAEHDEKESPKISVEAMQILQNYNWPGNVRQLHQTITRATIFSDGNVITPDHLLPLTE